MRTISAVSVLVLTLAVVPESFGASACNSVIASQEKAANQVASAVAAGTTAAMSNMQANQASQQSTSSGCFSSLKHFGGSMNYPQMSGLLSSLESMACSMSSGVVMGSVSSMTSPVTSAYSNYGLGGNAGFGQSGMTTQPSGPPPILESTGSSILGSASGGASSVFGNMGSSVSSKAMSAPGANMSTLPGTNRTSSGVSGSFNNIYKP